MSFNNTMDLICALFQFKPKVNKQFKGNYDKKFGLITPIAEIEDDFIFVNLIKTNDKLTNQIALNIKSSYDDSRKLYFVDLDNFFRIDKETFLSITDKASYILDLGLDTNILVKIQSLLNNEEAKFKLYWFNNK
ncbi:hypothetical protein GE118_03655 [Mycoplasma sp. NEAQ87857]|uniref:hypothetical protein n=1 Tax=Mycoplasma sp. NEAQ87857 TaxID=2683967 RepID=UPI0013179721|nr:hypothetical protein [Mycoplasma sp. NEAQ87857]QGZ97878.1 hypothetical protein GE118_03655 [Mycoplasma sp. NEAQ87857]